MATYGQFLEFGPYFSGGNLAGSIKVYHYVAGTTTDQDVYTDRDKTTPAAQPLVADASGIASCYADGLYKFVVKTSADVTLYTYDNVNATDVGALGEGAAIASASTLTLGTDGVFFHITGAVGITALSGTQTQVALVFDSTPTLTHSGSLILLGAANYTCVANDVLVFVNEGSGVWREISRGNGTIARIPTTIGALGTDLRVTSATALTYGADPGLLWGCTLSNNGSDATNDIDIAAGFAASNDAAFADRVIMTVPAVTKRLDASWVTGTNQGGLSSSLAIANTTYHVFAIRVAGVDDVGFDTSATAANLIADHTATHVRRIGSILRESAAIVTFVQDGDYFRRKGSVLDYNTTNPGTSAVTVTLSIPTGLNLIANGNAATVTDAGAYILQLSDLAATDEAPSATAAPLGIAGETSGAVDTYLSPWQVRTNTSSQIRARVNNSSAGSVVRIATMGWFDQRGR